jgi:hypothetical protein
MAQRYCTNCGAQLGEEDRFCAKCGRPTHETAKVVTPEADVQVPPPPQDSEWNTTAAPSQEADKPRISIGTFLMGFFLIVGLLWLIVPTGGGSGNSNDGQRENNDPPPAAEKKKPAPAQEEQPAGKENLAAQEQPEPEKVYGIGDRVNVGDVTYTVISARPKTRLRDTYGIDPPKTGNFVVVDFTFTNNGTDPVTMSDVGLYLYDSKNREYETDSDMFGYIPEAKDIFLLDRINPGLSKQAQVIYTVPPDASGFELEVTSGFFASEVERIKLGF